MSRDTIATLRRDIEATTDPNEKVILINRLSEALLYSDYRQGMHSIRKGVALARRVGDPALLVESLLILETFYFEKERYSRTAEVLAEIAALLDEIPDNVLPRVRYCRAAGSLNLVRGNY